MDPIAINLLWAVFYINLVLLPILHHASKPAKDRKERDAHIRRSMIATQLATGQSVP